MVIAIFALVSLCLLFVDPNLTALTWSDFPNPKFFVNLLTYQLDHANLPHFVGNYAFMAPYAVYLESKIGRRDFVVFYFIVGIMSAVVFWLSGATAVGLIGSSGSAFGVFTAACLAFNDKEWKRWAGFSWIGIVLGLQFVYATGSFFSNVAYWGHLGGAAAGAVLAYYFVPCLPLAPAPQKKAKRPSRSKRARRRS